VLWGNRGYQTTLRSVARKVFQLVRYLLASCRILANIRHFIDGRTKKEAQIELDGGWVLVCQSSQIDTQTQGDITLMSAWSLALARVIHVVGIVFWIGGVAFVTTIVIPALRRLPSGEERLRLFEAIEGRFSVQAKVVTLVTGFAGVYMVQGLDAWGRYLDLSFWWFHLMTLVWLVFTVVLSFAERDSDRAFRLLHRFHVLLLTVSLIAIAGAVAGVRGFLRFG